MIQNFLRYATDEPLRRFLRSWKSIGSLKICCSQACNSDFVSDVLLKDSAASDINNVSLIAERLGGITDDGIISYFVGGNGRKLSVVSPQITADFLARLIEVSKDNSEVYHV